MSDFNIRKARPEDALHILQCRERSILQKAAGCYNKDEIAGWVGGAINEKKIEACKGFIENGNVIFLIAEMPTGDITGFGNVVVSNTELKNLYTSGPIRGCGKALIIALEQEAMLRGVTTLTLRSSLCALPFYLAMGYANEGHIQHTMLNGLVIECVNMRRSITT